MADAGLADGNAARVRWRLRLLGAFELDDGRQRLTRLASRAAVGLLARLAMSPQRAFGREELAALLWPDADAGTGRARLRQTLSTLRALLEPPQAATGAPPAEIIAADRRVLQLAPSALRCDVHEFEQACRGGDSTRALALYRGELLPGFHDEWIVDERRRLQALAERFAERLAERPAEAAPTDVDAPPRPPAPAAPPVVSTPPAEPAAPLPRYLGPLFGAEPLLARLQAQVSAHRLVTLVGPGGVGKTRLAVELAQRLQDAGAPFDAVRFVPWVGCSSAAQAADRLALALELDDPGEPLRTVTRALAGRSVLLVLDNAEQLAPEAVALVAALAARLPRLHLLVTSRRALALDGEQEFALDPLPTPPPGADAAVALDSPAVQLFTARARATRADFHVHAGNAGSVGQLVRLLDGLPLALELAAARVRTLPPARLLALLQTPQPDAPAARWALLARPGPRAADDPRHASMLAVVDWSWRLLSPTQAALLRLLALAPAAAEGGLAEQAALHAGVTASAADARVLLDALAAASLLRRAPGADDRLWWSVPEPVADVAREHADTAPAAATARAAWRRVLLDWASALPATVPLREVDETLPAVLGALRSALDDGAADQVLRLLLALAPAWAERSLPAGGLQALQQALAVGDADDELAARAHALAAQLCAA
ncbi:MAG: NACHT domain-containing protein, partial [Rubrivivax sp.]|nr:NACHT domain-containing protein [Rubrivivax sp.]